MNINPFNDGLYNLKLSVLDKISKHDKLLNDKANEILDFAIDNKLNVYYLMATIMTQMDYMQNEKKPLLLHILDCIFSLIYILFCDDETFDLSLNVYNSKTIIMNIYGFTPSVLNTTNNTFDDIIFRANCIKLIKQMNKFNTEIGVSTGVYELW